MAWNALFTGFLASNEKPFVLLYPINGVAGNGFMFQFSGLIKNKK